MANVKKDTSIKNYQEFNKEVYGIPNNRYFSVEDMLINIQRYTMRALKGIRKDDTEKTKRNLIIAESWFMSLLNQLNIDIEDAIWKRFPYLCLYCGTNPCTCKINKSGNRIDVAVDHTKRPITLKEFQKMFEDIYPASLRTLENAGVHLAEECGEFSEAILIYRGKHQNEDFDNVITEAADFFSCLMGVFNSLHVDVSNELSILFNDNCLACKKAPCECTFSYIMDYR